MLTIAILIYAAAGSELAIKYGRPKSEFWLQVLFGTVSPTFVLPAGMRGSTTAIATTTPRVGWLFHR